MKYEAPWGLEKLNNFDYRLGGAPTPNIDYSPDQSKVPAPKPMSQIELDFIRGNHPPKKDE